MFKLVSTLCVNSFASRFEILFPRLSWLSPLWPSNVNPILHLYYPLLALHHHLFLLYLHLMNQLSEQLLLAQAILLETTQLQSHSLLIHILLLVLHHLQLFTNHLQISLTTILIIYQKISPIFWLNILQTHHHFSLL